MANKNDKNDKIKNNKSFFKEYKSELKKVTWPTPKQLVNNTIGVLVIVVIVAIIVFVLDLVFKTVNEQGIYRLRNVVQTEQNIVSEETVDLNINNTVLRDTGTENEEEKDAENKAEDENKEINTEKAEDSENSANNE